MWQNRIVANTLESPEQLLAHYANPRRHEAGQREAMRAALDEIGIIAACTVNDRTGNMLDGHMRCEEYITEGVTEIPVTHVDLSEEEELKALACFDGIASMAKNDPEALTSLLELINFESEVLTDLVAKIKEDADKLIRRPLPEKVNDIPEVETPVSKLGDLWELGDHRVLCGDSTASETLEVLMRGGGNR